MTENPDGKGRPANSFIAGPDTFHPRQLRLRGVHDVGEHYGGENSVQLDLGARASQELLPHVSLARRGDSALTVAVTGSVLYLLVQFGIVIGIALPDALMWGLFAFFGMSSTL